MSVHLRITNVKIEGEWISGVVTVEITEIGLNLSTPFRTKKDVEQTIDLGSGIKLVGVLTLEAPNNVCFAGEVKKPPFSYDFPKQCFPIG
ncbi:hypothetical protein BJ123_1318 [Rhodopseudomonas thermotolerans]|uniref:Uncharacterized protein n=2 Tax=Rhodopseudomonas TaxID=1073 RepID=A0A336JUK3_9BRAD|nr:MULTISPECIES: hypothetical protein [Rhodopseudomonas]RED25540.1 hypothetical protein BJ125_1318 [Rhodopseudomonas pentothenatexigens]REF90370.1 hypothetical protein BJ123_1318 [Rhodopseudomonas thermotolerans]SSW93152.1 hypothetical protein SAMN05892882_1318 [Rhodopseudomonas pentothenatexigens]